MSQHPTSDEGLGALRSKAGLFGLLCVATFFEGFDTKLASFVQPVIGEDFGASVDALGTALGVSSFGMVLAFFVILLADRVGRRPVFLGALFAYAVFTLATAFAPNLVVFTILQFFGRMAMVVELFIGYVILSEEMPPSVRGRVNGLFGATAVLGAAVPAALLAPLEAAGPGWRGLFLIGALPLLFIPLYLRRVPETRAFRERGPSSEGYGAEFAANARALWNSAERGRLLRVAGIWLAVNFWSGTALYFFTYHVFEEHGWTAADLQWLPWGTIPFGLAGYVVAGFAMDRFGRRPSAAAYLLSAFVATAYCYRATTTGHIYFGFFLLYGLGGIWTILTTWTAELFPTERRATALAIANNLIGRMGLVFGPIAAGMASATWGSTRVAIVALASVTLAAIPLVWTLPETKGADLLASDPVDSEGAATGAA